MLHLNTAMVHYWKELFVQFLKPFMNNPWLALLDPDVITDEKKSSSIFGSVCQSCDEIPDREREGGRERASEHNAGLWSDRSIPFRTSRWNTKRKVSWHEGQTFCRKVDQIYFSVWSVWWTRRSHFGSGITCPDLQRDELQRPETYWPLRAIWGYFMCN